MRDESYDLSPRERDVLMRIADGYTITQIAAMLGLSVKTVSTYRMRVIDKLLASHAITSPTTTALIRYAFMTGLVR